MKYMSFVAESKEFIKLNWPYIFVGLTSTIMLVSFFDVYLMWFADEGVFGHLAERVLQGDIYGVDVYDFHGGYQTFLNAWLFQNFGIDLVVLRYPMVILGVIQALLVTYLLRNISPGIAAAGGMSSVVFGFLLFPNPSPNWYALFFAVLTITILSTNKINRLHILTTGFIIGLCFMFRHPSAVYLTLGVLTYLLYRLRTNEVSFCNKYLTQGFLLILGIAVITYSYLVFEPLAFALFALPPLVIIVLIFRLQFFNFQAWLKQVTLLFLGFSTAITPMVVYQILYGSTLSWFYTAFVSGTQMIKKDFFNDYTYIQQIVAYISSALNNYSINIFILETFFWLVVMLTPITALLLTFKNFNQSIDKPLHPVLFIAPFFGLVSFHFQITFYFFISFIIFLIAILVQLPKQSNLTKIALYTLIFINIWGSISPMHGFVFATRQNERLIESSIPKANLLVKENIEYQSHKQLIDYIKINSDPKDNIYVLPMNPEIYFLSSRNNPFPFIMSGFSIYDDKTYDGFLSKIFEIKPKFIIFNQEDKYATEYDFKFYALIKENPNYEYVNSFGDFQIFLLSPE